jgi:beta-galactosidase
MKLKRLEQSLDGEWQLALDPEDVGIREQWYAAAGRSESISVQVPSVWDRWVPDYDGVGWYFREFDLDAAWEDRTVSLEFEAADYYAEVWVNGKRIGEHEGGYTPFSLNASSAVSIGTNRVAVRIVDPHGPQGHGNFRTKQIPSAKEHGYFSFAGIWGSVSVLGRSPAYISDVFVRPDLRRKRIAVLVEASQAGEVQLRVEGTGCETSGQPGELLLELPDFEPWSPANPKLYTLACDLIVDGETVDSTTVRFGMREFTAKEGRFFLNHQPIQIRGVLHQPDYARSLAAPESEEIARRELELAKEAGFNLIRAHIKTPPRITLDLADEIGLLVYEEPPIGWIEKTPHMAERCEREVREMVLRDRNHPCVVIWGMLNESGNAGYVVNGGAQVIKEDLCKLARSLDPTRLIIDDSGGINATREPSRLIRPYREDFEPYDDLHIYQRAPVDREIELYYERSGAPDQLYFLSEFGFGGMEDLEDVLAQYGEEAESLKDARFLRKMLDAAQEGFAERGLDRVFGSFAGFGEAARQLQCDAARHQIDAIRSNPKMAGYCYTQLCDAGHEFCAGVLDRWRRPKPVHETLKEVQKPLRPLIRTDRTNLILRQEIKVSVVLANDERLEGRADLSLQVVGPTNQVLWKKKRNVKIPRAGKELWQGAISASGSPGTHRFVVRLMQSLKVVAESSLEFHVFEPVKPCDVPIHVVDPDKKWTQRCVALAERGEVHAPVHIVPPLANTVRAYPAEELCRVLADVNGGAVAIVFGPPDDWNDLANHLDEALTATSKDAVGAFLGVYHYVKLHPVFDGLPSRGLMRQPYRDTVPAKTFVEQSDEDICGCFDTTPIATGNYMMGETTWWGSDILVKRYGSGRIVFTHLRLFEHLGRDPVADRLFVNLLKHFSRRSVPSSEPMHAQQRAEGFLKNERTNHLRHWKVIGMFPNWGDKGHDEVYPPEREQDFTASYLGWYKPAEWRSWYSRAEDGHLVDLQQAFTPIFEYYPRFDHGTGYAYAELTSDRRIEVSMVLGVQDAMKVWLNGTLVFVSTEHRPHKDLEDHTVPVMLRQGRNTVLVKVSKVPGEFQFSLDLKPVRGEPHLLKWWP